MTGSTSLDQHVLHGRGDDAQPVHGLLGLPGLAGVVRGLAPGAQGLAAEEDDPPKDAPGFGDDELLAHGVLLAAEVVSPSSQRRDRVAKVRAYAQGRVPVYLLIDEVTDPATLTLFSDPDESSYRSCVPAMAGQALRLPEPFGIALDTRRLLG
jgi:Putative restriction endonuclease